MNFNPIKLIQENFWPSLRKDQVYPLFNEERNTLPEEKKIVLKKEVDRFSKNFKRTRRLLLISNIILYTTGFQYWWLFALGSLGYTFIKSQNLKSLPSYLKKHSPKVKSLFGNIYKYKVQRQLKYDPVTLSIDDIQIGFLADYRTRTYQVIDHQERSLGDDYYEEKFSILEAATLDQSDFNEMVIFKDNINSTPEIYVGQKVNIFRIKDNLDTEIKLRGKANNTYEFYHQPYYLEYGKNGFIYSFKTKKVIGTLKKWFYLNETRDKFLSIYQIDTNEFEAYSGEIVSDSYFTDILPRK
ncbi:hypothetical protein [Flammeovirga pacifica]|uniref:DUF4178 domain-containing protein n=1 Tax=Flammeovirga pacifica TaxID=915059 RepID=A0A1S1YWV1_FLAPC|nr:hypothetical protein [Flammeovirga pacifica]OHX65478.1 hypothetical protein NH26_03500 [Flammeovirga pacifica]